MRVLLVEPNYKNKYPPIGLMKISSYHKKHKHYYEWYFGFLGKKDFDPVAFDLDEVNRELQKYVWWSRDRVLRWEEV